MATEKSTMNVRCNFLPGKGGFPASLVSFTRDTNSLSMETLSFFSRWDEKFRRHFATESTPQTVEWWTSRGKQNTPQVGMLHMGDPRGSFFVVFGFVCFFLVWCLFFSNKNIVGLGKISGDFHQLTKKNLKVICREKLFGESRSPYSEGIPKEGNFLG